DVLQQLERNLVVTESALLVQDELPTLYEYYTEGGIVAGLETLPDTFQLNKKNITLFSGAIHYFRVHPEYWRDRLRKLRAAGFNTVETYVPWNLHEPQQDVYDFGDGGNDMSNFLDVVKYVQIAQEEDLFVLMRSTPYICAEWDFGGLPSWLLRIPGLVVRSSEPQFIDRVSKFYDQLLPLFQDLQFTRGGPIIGFQIENEYGGLVQDGSEIDYDYLLFLKDEFGRHDLVELLYTSDNPSVHGSRGSVPGVLQTANFQNNPELEFSVLKINQPDKPLMAMEYWTFSDVLERILKAPASVNLYMFHGGTNFGFMSGANAAYVLPKFQADVTSYDYNAPLSEAGDFTAKYNASKEIVAKYNKVLTKLPDAPAESVKTAYKDVPITEQLDYSGIIDRISADDRESSETVKSMENLSINNGNGQSYGYVVYRYTAPVELTDSSNLQIKNGVVRDMAIVLLDGDRQTETLTTQDQISGFGYWETSDAMLQFDPTVSGERNLDIFVENWGRVNFGVHSDFDQRKGLREEVQVLVDDVELSGWEIIALQFKSEWVRSLNGWQPFSGEGSLTAPKLMRAILNVESPTDTFIDMSGWGRGIVFVNGFNLGRYFSGGPLHSLYVPAPLLKAGENEIVIFELFTAGSVVHFSDQPILGMADIPTLYDYYTEGGIVAGLETVPDTFLLNKKNITLFSGAIHYFRVHPNYWRDRLRKLRAAGFNVVETDTLDRILKFPSSVNLYMFHGGTNFGFLNGANVKGDFPHYNAPLSEAGDYTDKYRVCKELVEKYNKVITKLPPPPAESKKVTFPSIPITEQMDYTQILENIGPEDRDVTDDVVSMEHLKINNGNGQSYGYIIYRHSSGVKVKESSKLQIKDGVVHDMAIVLLDEERQTEILTNQNQLKGFGYWETPNSVLNIESKTKKTKTLDILVENWGRVNFGLHSDFEQCKGLRKGTKILFDNEHVKGWETFSLQFKSKWLRG
ncbi:hypothetical protein C0J52_17739, partial [Blattella germanica]